jgi:hypothetical protein
MSKCGNIHGFPWTIHGTPTIHGAPTIHGNSMDSWSWNVGYSKWSWNGGRFHGFHPVPPLRVEMPPYCMLTSVYKIKPGSYFTCDSTGYIEHINYWDLDYPDKVGS